MDLWDRQPLEDRHRCRRQNPSFSSSLLDAIYRSIDETNGTEGEKAMRKNQTEKIVVRRTSMADFDRKARNVRDRDRDSKKKLTNSSSSSSESSCGGGFSSSESESRSCSYTMQMGFPPAIRIEKLRFNGEPEKVSVLNQKPKHENGFVKTKSKALKIYGDLKKVKQPISPGGRLATFLNSLFNGGSPKKTKPPKEACMRKSKSAQASTCSSASSFSRSCLSKTASSSSEKLCNNGGTKRSVRFCPVSVILDEESRPCGHKSLRDELGLMAVRKEDVMNSYQKKTGGVYRNREEEEEEDEDEDEEEDEEDAVSCSSSDLFELDNLSSIGIQRYREELPVYETTHFSTNQAIANGIVL